MKTAERLEIEKTISASWEKNWPFKFKENSKQKIFSIDTPPPYINADLHVGHAASYTYIDTTARVKRAFGFNVLFPFGLDKNGLPIEVQAEKEFGVDIRKTNREEYIKACKTLLDKYRDKNRNVFRGLGFSFNDYEFTDAIGSAYETDSEKYRTISQSIFIKLWREGKIYEDTQLVNYCTVCHTTLSDAEVEYEEKDTKLYTIKIKIDGKDFKIATTRPELIPACAAIGANPTDKDHSKLKTAKMPITGAEVPVIFDESIDPNFGSGIMMICSYGDKADLALFQKHGLKETLIIDENGKIKDVEGYSGLSVFKAREKIIDELKAANLIVKEETIRAEKPICWRSKNNIELIREKELYLSQKDLKEDLLNVAKSMRFYRDGARQTLLDWIKAIDRDWPLSRTRYYGTEIPLWKCSECDRYTAPAPGKYYQPWRTTPIDLKCEHCSSSKLIGDTRILDTWMDSSHSNLFILGYLWKPAFFEKSFPVSFRPQGKEIIRSWLFYTMLESYHLTGKKPFHDVLITNHAVDEAGEKFSKSKGNGIPIEKALKENGGDIIRLWAYLGGDLVNGDIRYSKEKINEAERIVNKISNIVNFVGLFGKDKTSSVNEINEFDSLFLQEFNRVYNDVLADYEIYDFTDALKELKTFLINVFADHFLELRKPAAYENDPSAIYTLNYVIKNSLELLNPIAPFFTEHLYKLLYSDEIHEMRFEKKSDSKDNSKEIDEIADFDSHVWTTKKTRGLPLNGEINDTPIPPALQKYKDILIKAHKIKV